MALAIALLQGTALTFLLGRGGTNSFTGQSFAAPLLPDFDLWRVLIVVGTLTVGVALVMWFGELISQRGIGNGMSLIIMASVVSRLPFDAEAVRKEPEQEMGYRLRSIRPLFTLYMSPGASAEKLHLFAAEYGPAEDRRGWRGGP